MPLSTLDNRDDADYIYAGFLADVFDPWMELLTQDEWGIYVHLLWQTATAAISLGYMAKAKGYMNDVLEEFERQFEQGLMSETDRGVPKVRREFPAVRRYWREQANHFGSRAPYDEVMARLPAWAKPPSRRRATKG